MIHADETKIAEIIAADSEMLRAMHRFLYLVIGDDDMDPILEALPAMIAAHSPFENEAALVAVVERETLRQLHKLALSRLPARGSA